MQSITTIGLDIAKSVFQVPTYVGPSGCPRGPMEASGRTTTIGNCPGEDQSRLRADRRKLVCMTESDVTVSTEPFAHQSRPRNLLLKFGSPRSDSRVPSSTVLPFSMT
jgi:hypothetical protein